MAENRVDRAFVRKLASNLRARTGVDVKHTDLIADIASAFGKKPDAFMHELKAKEGRAIAAGSPPRLQPTEDQIAHLPSVGHDGPGWAAMMQPEAMSLAKSYGFEMLARRSQAVFWKKNLCDTSNDFDGESEIYVLVSNGDAMARANDIAGQEWSARLCIGSAEGALLDRNGAVRLGTFEQAAKDALCLLPWVPNPEQNWTSEQVAKGGVCTGSKLGRLDDIYRIFQDIMNIPFARLQAIAGIESGDVAALFYDHGKEIRAFIQLIRTLPPGNWQTFSSAEIQGKLVRPEPVCRGSIHALRDDDALGVASGFVADLAQAVGLEEWPFQRFVSHVAEMLEEYVDFEKIYAAPSPGR